jgi:hypothetical protein
MESDLVTMTARHYVVVVFIFYFVGMFSGWLLGRQASSRETAP